MKLHAVLLFALSFAGLAHADPPATAVEPTVISLHVGGQASIKEDHLRKVAIGDPAIADVQVSGTDELIVSGEGTGKTMLLAFHDDGSRSVYLVQVDP